MENIYIHLPDKVKKYVMNYTNINNVTEIRMRADNILQFTENGKVKYIEDVYIYQNELEELFYSMCDYSQNAYEDEISNGFIGLRLNFKHSLFTLFGCLRLIFS